MATVTIRVRELLKINGNPLMVGEEEDMLLVTFDYKGKTYRSRQPFEDVSDAGKLTAFLDKVIKKVPSLVPDQKIENLSEDAKGDYVVTE